MKVLSVGLEVAGSKPLRSFKVHQCFVLCMLGPYNDLICLQRSSEICLTVHTFRINSERTF